MLALSRLHGNMCVEQINEDLTPHRTPHPSPPTPNTHRMRLEQINTELGGALGVLAQQQQELSSKIALSHHGV